MGAPPPPGILPPQSTTAESPSNNIADATTPPALRQCFEFIANAPPRFPDTATVPPGNDVVTPGLAARTAGGNLRLPRWFVAPAHLGVSRKIGPGGKKILSEGRLLEDQSKTNPPTDPMISSWN
jgi:hypothetical protein